MVESIPQVVSKVNLNKRLVLLDRDGVINKDIHRLVVHPEDLYLLSNALRAIARLTQAGIRVGICTNQGGVERGMPDEAMLRRIHAKLQASLKEFGGEVARIIYCPTTNPEASWCKPNPGMLLNQAAYFATDLSGVPFVGDNWVDVIAARAANAVPVLVKTGNGAQTLRKYRQQLTDVEVFPNLEEAVRQWLS